jgi:hypothetical protein
MNRFNMDQDELDDLRWEYRFEREEALPEMSKCDWCGAKLPVAELQATNDGTDTPIFCCETCKHDVEMQVLAGDQCECDCVVTGDQADASMCMLHGSRRGPQQARLFPVKEVA